MILVSAQQLHQQMSVKFLREFHASHVASWSQAPLQAEMPAYNMLGARDLPQHPRHPHLSACETKADPVYPMAAQHTFQGGHAVLRVSI